MLIIPRLPSLFLTRSNQRLWVAKAPFNEKYERNYVKLIKAFVKVLEKQAEQYCLEITCLKIKLMEFTKDYKIESLNMLSGVEIYLQDTKEIGSETIQRSYQLNLKQAELIPVNSSTQSSQSITDKQYLSTLKATNYSSLKMILDLFAKSKTSTLSTQQIAILDSVTLFCQSNIGPDLVSLLEQLYDIFKSHDQTKRIRNVSNLLFKLGSKTNDISLLELAIKYEYNILQHQQSEKHFENLVLKIRMAKQYSPCMMKVLLQACEMCNKLDQTTIGLVNRILLTNVKLVECLNEIREQYRFSLVTELLKNMGNWNAQKTLICNAIVQGVSFDDIQLSLQLHLAYYNVGELTI